MLGESTIRGPGLLREAREGVPEKAVLELRSGGAGARYQGRKVTAFAKACDEHR